MRTLTGDQGWPQDQLHGVSIGQLAETWRLSDAPPSDDATDVQKSLVTDRQSTTSAGLVKVSSQIDL